jgi:hypothetical protein
MAVHVPVHHAGFAGPHVLRNALLAVVIAVLAIMALFAAVTYKPTATTTTATDPLLTPQMIEFRADEHAMR